MTIQQLEDFSNTKPELRYLTEEIIKYIADNPGGGGGEASHTVYTALWNQAGTDAPTATVLENTTGRTVTWERTGLGIYKGVISGTALDLAKVFLPNGDRWGQTAIPLAGSTSTNEYSYTISVDTQAGVTAIYVYVYLTADFSSAEFSAFSYGGSLPIEFRIYP